MKVLLLGMNYAPEMVGTGKYTTGMAGWLARKGHDVQVVAAQPYYPGWKVHPGHSRWRYSRAHLEGVDVLRCPHYVPGRPTGVRRLLHHLSFALTAVLALLWSALLRRPDVVLVVAPALLAAPAGWLVARLSGARCWLHLQDFEVEAACATGLLSDTGPVAWAAKSFERWILRRFDRVSTISDPMRRRLITKGIPPERLRELRNWADLEGVKPDADGAALRAELGLTRPAIALYSGSIANKQGLEIIATAAAALSHRTDLEFLICGEGPFLPELRCICEGLPVRFCPLQPADRLGALLSIATVHLLPQVAGAADLLLPSKLTNMLASGRPTVVTAAAGTALAREVDGCGIVVAPGDGSAFAAAIAALMDNAALRASFGSAARKRAHEHWAPDAILTKFEAELVALLPPAPFPEGERAWQR